MSDPSDSDTLRDLLDRILKGGTLARIPRHPAQRDHLLATLSTALHRRYPYGERELGEVLIETLETLNSTVDHVTARRYLVDCGFLKRDRAGNRYYLNFERLRGVLDTSAQEVALDLAAKAIAAAQARASEKAARAERYRAAARADREA
ncbi:MAG: DUF2087 domain-containing protein [Pseudomonadota bacterium]